MAIDTAFVKQYQSTVTLLAQQADSRLRSCVMVDTNWTGEEKYYDQYGSDSMVEIMTRYADTPVQSTDHQRRRVIPRYFVSNTLIDPQDSLAMLIDPASAYMQAKRAAAGRKTDDLIIAALGGTAYAGKAGGTSTTLASYDSGSHVIASGSAGMTKTKIITAKIKLDESEADDGDRYMVCAGSQFGDLLNTTEATSVDFNTVRALVEGTLNTWLGFTWKRSERLTDSSGRVCFAWQKKGLQLAIQKDVEGRIDERPDKNYARQVYMRLCMGATRLEEARVVSITCTETF